MTSKTPVLPADKLISDHHLFDAVYNSILVFLEFLIAVSGVSLLETTFSN